MCWIKMRRVSPFERKKKDRSVSPAKNSACVAVKKDPCVGSKNRSAVCRRRRRPHLQTSHNAARERMNSGMCCRCWHALPMTIDKRRRESPMQKKNFPVCQEGLLSVSPSSNNRKFPVCRDGSVGRISRRVSPCKEEVVCRL
mgnify:CR=1 FL=1